MITGELDHKPELPILLDLLAEAEESAGAPVLRRWVRAAGPAGVPLDLLVRRDFAGFRGRAGDARRARLRAPLPLVVRIGRFSPGQAPVR